MLPPKGCSDTLKGEVGLSSIQPLGRYFQKDGGEEEGEGEGQRERERERGNE
jgi:hypothetical protein